MGNRGERIDEVTNISNAIFSEPQINGDDVQDSCLASWYIGFSNGTEGHFRCVAIVGYEISSTEDSMAESWAEMLTKHVRCRTIKPSRACQPVLL